MAIKRLLSIAFVMVLLSVFVGCDDGYEVDSSFFENTFVTSSKEMVSSKFVESQETTSSAVQSSEVSITQESETNSKTVYITPSGKRWHLNENCAGKNAMATTLEKAEEKSLTPCKKCVS